MPAPRSHSLPAAAAAPTSHAAGILSPALGATALIAAALPTLLGYSSTPSSTFYNQAAALIGWGLFAAVLLLWLPKATTARSSIGEALLTGTLGLLIAGVLLSMAHFGLPGSLGWSSAALIAAALLVVWVGSAVQRAGRGEAAFQAFCLALLVAGVLSLVIAVIQYVAPSLTDGNWLSRPSAGGRMGANLRQPNHLSSLLLAGMAGLVWLHERAAQRWAERRLTAQWVTGGLMLALTFGVVLTVSRTGAVCAVLLALWGAADQRLSRFSRLLLGAVPFVFALGWFGLELWSHATAHAFAGESQLNKSDLSSSRFAIWSNTVALIKAHPWLGVGWGEFNFAWTLTPFPGRPVAFFDHTHNLPLQFAVELGLPLATVVMALILGALWCAFRSAATAIDADSGAARASLVMVVMVGVHSMLEYPLWYAYFLLPTAFAFGIVLGARRRVDAPAVPWRARYPLLAGSIVLALGGLLSIVDYWRVVEIFAPSADAPSLDDRIIAGSRSVFFAHHAAYAAATTEPHPSAVPWAFASAPHFLLDARLMMAWSKALAEQGDLERARHVAQRLKEFRNPAADEFFAPCNNKPAAAPLPYQCTPPTRTLGYEDFRGR